MSEEGPSMSEIGPMDNSPEASEKRFEARQKHKETTKGDVMWAANLESTMNKIDAKEARKKDLEPDSVEEHSILGGLLKKKVKKWNKK